MFRRLLFLFFLFTLDSCIDLSDNKNEIIKERTDYEGIKNCILFIKSGGATVGDSYQISIVPYQDKLKDSDTGNIFMLTTMMVALAPTHPELTSCGLALTH